MVCSRFGINTDQIETLKQIGSCYGLSFECVRKIQTLALEKLQSILHMPRDRWAKSLDSTGHENKISDTDGYSPV